MLCVCLLAVAVGTTLEVAKEGSRVTVAHRDALYEVAPFSDVYSCSWVDLSPVIAAAERGGRAGTAAMDLIEPAIEPASALPYFHHITLYVCDERVKADPARARGDPFDCLGRPFIPGCERQLFSWGAGVERFEMPAGTGFMLPKLSVLQVHVKHTALQGPPITVAAARAGLRLRLTGDVKPFQFFQLGPQFGMLFVPPRAPRYQVSGVCAAKCFRKALLRLGIDHFEIIALAQHMHLLGSQAVTELIHKDGKAEGFGLVRDFNPNHAPVRFLERPLHVRAGDALQVTCIYNSTARAHATMVGPTLMDEMCFSYLIMHPPMPDFTGCWHANENMVPMPGAPCAAVCGIKPKRRSLDGNFETAVSHFTLPRGPSSRGALDPSYADMPDLRTCAGRA
jgi:hypothetical protein